MMTIKPLTKKEADEILKSSDHLTKWTSRLNRAALAQAEGGER